MNTPARPRILPIGRRRDIERPSVPVTESSPEATLTTLLCPSGECKPEYDRSQKTAPAGGRVSTSARSVARAWPKPAELVTRCQNEERGASLRRPVPPCSAIPTLGAGRVCRARRFTGTGDRAGIADGSVALARTTGWPRISEGDSQGLIAQRLIVAVVRESHAGDRTTGVGTAVRRSIAECHA